MLNKTKLEGKTKEEILNKYLSENNLEEKYSARENFSSSIFVN